MDSSEAATAWIPVPPLSAACTGQLLHFSGLQSPHLETGDNPGNLALGSLEQLKELECVKHLEWHVAQSPCSGSELLEVDGF